MDSTVAPATPYVPTAEAWVEFEAALRERRDRVYTYLDSWRGAGEFRPLDIHDALFSYIRRRGKALRSLLLLLSCSAVGGDEEQAIPAAAAVEVFQTWTLVHDDIIDRDRTRRGQPTVHAAYEDRASGVMGLSRDASAHYGMTVAILTGDLQQSWVYALLVDLAERGVDPSIILDLVRRIAESLTPHLLEGEMLDVQFSLPRLQPPSEDDVLDMITKKSAALFEYAAWCGATIGLGTGTANGHYADSLARFARLCGTAFQLQDDVLGLLADEATLGKPVGSDLREGKLTYIMCRALARADAHQRGVLQSVLSNSTATPAQINTAIAVAQETGAISDTAALANSYIDQALMVLDELPPTSARSLLRTWAVYMRARTY